MSIPSRTYFRRIIHAFSTRTRVGVLAFTVLGSLWLVAQFVLAEKESNIYIFPSTVSSEGWGNADGALTQDLSLDAELGDFTTENSAFLFFGASISTTTSDANEAVHAETEPAVEDAVFPDVTPSLVPTVVPAALPERATPEDVILPTNGSSEQPSDAVGATPLDIPNPLLPTMTVPDIAAPVPTESASRSSRLLLSALEYILSPSTARAQDVPSETVLPDTEDVVVPLEASSSSPSLTALMKVSSDPYTVASCTTEGIPCHIMTFMGFGIGDALNAAPLLSARLQLSVAARGDFAGDVHDRLVVRAYHDGRWEFLGETEIKGELSNGKRGGYLSYELSDVATWIDLADVRVVVEYVRERGETAPDPSSIVVDGVWVNATYADDTLTDASPETLALSGANLRSVLLAKDTASRDARRDILVTPEGETRMLLNESEYDNATLSIKTDLETYHALGKTSSYFNVTNTNPDAQVVRLQFHLPVAPDGSSGARVTSLSRFSHHVPYKVGSLKYDAVGYFCAGAWAPLSPDEISSNEGKFTCKETGEVRACPTLNDDHTNCIEDSARVGLSEEVEYRDGWTMVPTKEGSFRDDVGIFRKALDFILSELPDGAIPHSEEPVAFADDTFVIEPGQTLYFRADMDVPLNTKGEFFVEAAAESGSFGLVHASWDGSWNYRVPMTVANGGLDLDGAYAVPVQLDELPASFFDHVGASGDDLRFVSGDGIEELPYWLASWDRAAHRGLAWVRIPQMDHGTTTVIFVYGGDLNAESRSDPAAPFRSDTLIPRAIVFGKSQEDLTVHALALADNVAVTIGSTTPVLLAHGESALFPGVHPGAAVLATGPVSLAVETPGGNATVVPMGYAATHALIPGVGGNGALAIAVSGEENAYAEIRVGEAVTALDPVPASLVSTPLDLASSHRLDADLPINAAFALSEDGAFAPLYPATVHDLFGFSVGTPVAGFSENASALTARCAGSGALQETDGRREGAALRLDRCESGIPALADALVVEHISNPIGVVGLDGARASSFVPEMEFATQYVLTEDATQVLLLCTPSARDTAIGIFDPQGTLLASTTCSGYGPRPGKSSFYTSGVFPVGSSVRTLGRGDAPFLAGIESVPATLSDVVHPFSLLSGAPLSRGIAPFAPDISFGAEEFVIPGEHRSLDVDQNGKEKDHIDELLSAKREFSVHEEPGFRFRYIPRSGSFMQGVRDALGIKPFVVTRVSLHHPSFGDMDMENEISYGDDNTWSLVLKNTKERLHPGKYTLLVEIEEGGSTYEDEFDFYWGVLAVNYNKSVFIPGETVDIAMAALSDNGNTLCDARLKLWITLPAGGEEELPVDSSQLCNGNNVVDVPDYTSVFHIPSDASSTGMYTVKLVRFDEYDNMASQVVDSFVVRESVPIVIEREGPTRIYPIAHYPMKLRVTALDDFQGDIVERLPGDFVVIDRGNANLEWGDDEHTFMTATWSVDMKAGQVVTFTYEFDAPDRSPYVYLLGPAKAEGTVSFTEERSWQIASDAVGLMYIYWDQSTLPSGWNCVSCNSGQVFYQKFMQGSSTYNTGLGGGAATDTPTFTATLFTTGSTGVGPATTNNTTNAKIGHSHGFTASTSGVSNLPAYRDLVVLQWAGGAGEPTTLPTGAIVPFQVASSSLPSGWNRYTALDGRYVRGASTSTVGTTGGANTHSVTVTGIVTAAADSGLRSNGTSGTSATQGHTHTFTATSTNTQNTEPPYSEMIFAKLTATATPPNTMIGMWDNTPPSGWMTISDTGGSLNGKFMKASTTYGGSGGAVFHTYNDIIGATTSIPSATAAYNANASNAQAPGDHIHTADITGFSPDDTRPPYVDVVFAKRVVDVVFFEQNFYRFFVNEDANTPTDAWPAGGSNISENLPIDASTVPVKPGDVLRLRMSLNAANATATVAAAQFKLQYVDANDCGNALNWSDVGGIGSSAAWRGYDNAGVVNHVTLATTTITTSNVVESYEEENISTGTPTQIGIGQNGEWDWVVEDNFATSSTNYCFRMVRSDGTPLDTYTDYPQALTNTAPGAPTLVTPFDNEKVGTTTPYLYFHSADAENDNLDYEIQVSTDVDFQSPYIDHDTTGAYYRSFKNVTNTGNSMPYNSGDTIRYQPPSGSALSPGATYWWRVRAKDAAGSNAWGSWSSARSLTVDTSVNISTWFQTTRAQFLTDTLSGATTTSSDDVQVISGSSSAILYGSEIRFSDATIGTAWGRMKWNSTQSPGVIGYQLEYQDQTTGVWSLVPDVDLPGNSAAFYGAVSSTSLLSVDAETYSVVRLRANLSNAPTTPFHLDWTLEWGYKVTTPAPTAPFDNAKVATVTPTFVFSSSDPQGDKLIYQVSWSTTTSFTASTTRSSDIHTGFSDTITGSTSPLVTGFTSGDVVNFTIQPADNLIGTTTYYYRIRARDPFGANDWSFWSDTRSLTVDTSITVATWFQTDNGQFLTDIFTSIRTISTGSTTVATSTDEAMFAYGEGTSPTPKYRIWDGLAWGLQKDAQSIGSSLRWAILRASPLYGEYALGTLGTDRDMNVQFYNNGEWGAVSKVTGTSPSLTRRSFDIAYETLSGKAMVVACTGTSRPTWMLRSATSSSWATSGTINFASTNDCEWIRMASHPKTNEIVLVARDTGPNYEAWVWNATSSTWGSSTGVFGSMTEVGHEGMAVEYEQSGDQAVVAVSRGNNAGVTWRAWRSSTASWTAAANQTMNDDFENGNMHRDPNADNLILCGVTQTPRVDVLRWTGAAWTASVDLSTVGLTKNDTPVDCAFENTPGRSGYIQTSFGDTTGTRYREWTGAAWQAQANITGLTTALSYTHQLIRTSFSGTILGAFFVPAVTSYYESHWATSSWSNAVVLENSASATSPPYGQPFSMAPKNPATQGTIISTPISFTDGAAPAWDKVLWSSTTPTGSSLKVQVQYYDSASSTWKLINDTDLPGNESGATSMSVNIKGLNTDTYHTIRLVANFQCLLTSCPVLHDWTVKWAQGVSVSGSARQHDLSTLPVNGTVVRVAVNGVLQSATGAISNGSWTIPNVTIFPGNTVEVFTSAGATSTRAVAIAKYEGPGDFGGLALNEHWVTVGSASGTAPSAVALTDLAKYDYSASGNNNDLFFDVDNTTGDYTHCMYAGCSDSSLYVLAGNTFRPASTSAKIISTYDMRIAGYVYNDANTLKVGASWRNLGGFTPGTGTLVFNATSSVRTIDSTGAATSTFGNVTFGEIATGATWTFVTPFTATGTVAMNFGTTSPVGQVMTLQGNLSIGVFGTFQKGTATTTFSGSGSNTWTDLSASKQDLGNITVSGSTKTITLASSVKATHVNVAMGNTLNAGGANTFTVFGFWDNNGTFSAQNGTVNFATTTATTTINQGTSSFYDVTFSGTGGAWRWLNTNATTTNDLTITAGSVTLPGGTLALGGSFVNNGGVFIHNSGIVRMYATLSGKNIRASSSSFFDLSFDGAGGAWTFLDTNATTTNNLTILAGTPTFPTGTLAVGRDFVNSSAFTANGGTLKMTSTLSGRTITVGSALLAHLTVAGAGIFTITDTNAQTTGDVRFLAGTTTLPSGTLTVGGSFANTAVFVPGSGTATFNTSSGLRTVDPGNSSFANVAVAMTGGTLTFSGNATTTGAFTLTTATDFVLANGKTLAVGGAFVNQSGGGATTWAGSTLALNSGTNMTINTKTTGGDGYGTLRLGTNTMIRSWNSSSTGATIGAGSSWYSQNHGAVPGELDIFGAYTQSSGTDYWSYATDFDGTALGGSPRQVIVRFDAGASASFGPGTTLDMVGTASASTTLDRRSTGNYGVTLSGATINAKYYQVRNMNATGLNLAGATSITSLDDGDFSLDVTGGSSITLASTTIDANPNIQIFRVKFATSSGVSSGANVTEVGHPSDTNYFWRFKDHTGNFAGEAHDVDPEVANAGDPGYVRWDNSNFKITISGRVYADAGVTPMGNPTCDNVTPVVRVVVDGLTVASSSCLSANGNYAITDVAFTGDTVMTVYLNTNGGAQAALVTRSAVNDLSGMNLYQHRVIVRHEDVLPMTIAKMALYSKTQDADIPFTATDAATDTLTTDPETELWIWNGMTFIPGGNITLQSGGSGATYDGTFHIDNGATFTAQGSEAHSVGGRFVADSGANFTAALSTFTFTATTTGKSITGIAPLTFWKMIFAGSGGNWSVNQTLTVNDNFEVNAGTVSGANNVTVYGTSLTGGGTITMTGGTFTLANGGTFGGASDWSFSNLTFGNGTFATTTRVGSSTVNVSGVLTVSSAQTLLAGTSTTWVLTGGGTPLVITGALSVQNATVRYAAGSASASVTPANYARLEFSETGGATPTYTLGIGTFTVGGSFVIGNASGSLVTVNANINDPAITASGDVAILPGATLVASDVGSFVARKNWTNQGTTTASGGTITFDATTTGLTIDPGTSSFGNVIFSNASGGWTIVKDATTTGNFSLLALSSFTMASGKTLDVGGLFENAVGGSATSWGTSTISLHSGTTNSVSKSALPEQYGTLVVGANTQVRMWNSVAATTTVVAGGASLYSQNHNNVSGSLYIYGNYTHTSGNDYWDHGMDFDGASVTPRQVNVRIASSSVLTFSGGSLEVIGSVGASTTIDVQGGGTYAWNVSGGALTMRYYTVRHTGASGLAISGTPTVSDLSYGDYALAVDGGTMISVSSSVIDLPANRYKSFLGNIFATSSGVSSGFNVTETGSPGYVWSFLSATGSRAGEAYDSDPGDPVGNPGFIRWDDSPAQMSVYGKVYSDEGKTVMGGAVCNGVTQNVHLRIQRPGGTWYENTSACDAGGNYSFSGVSASGGDTVTVFLASTSPARAVNVAYDPIVDLTMDLYQDRIILRHEQGTPISIGEMARFDGAKDSSITFFATTTGATSTTILANTGLIVWNSRIFAPGGNVVIHANASGNSWDGTVHLYATSTWSAAGTESYTIGGNFVSDQAATVAPANSTFTFTATTTGKGIAASSSLTFYNLTFNGTNGAWDLAGLGTTTNDLTITTGTTTLPSGTLVVGGSFVNNSGAFVSNGGTIKFNASASGKSIRANGSSFANLLFDGAGGAWTFTDTHATTTGSLSIVSGTPTFPAGIFAVGDHFDNQSGVFVAGNGTVKLTSTSTNRTVRLSGSALGNLIVSGTGTFLFLDQYATTTGNVTFTAGTTTFPFVKLAVGGSFVNTSVFVAGTSTTVFVATTTGKTIDPGNSSFAAIEFNSVVGGWTLIGNATTTGSCALTSAAAFTLASGKTLAVGGTFTNLVGGAATTWTGSTLALESGTNFTINTKSVGADIYETLRLGGNTQVRTWGSSASTVSTATTSGLYSQNHTGTSGLLYIYGNYTRTSGSDYWSYATDFDGMALGSPRQANIRFASNATATYTNNASLEMLGVASASTTIDRQGSGNYALTLSNSTWNAQYYQFRNMGLSGLSLLGTTTIVTMNNGDFSLDVSGGTMMTVASTTIDQNASAQIFTVKFATSSGVTSGSNVLRVGTTSSSITFNTEYGNYAGEAYDSDGPDGCGSIRWSDSACLISDQRAYRWRSDDGGEGALASEWYNQGWSTRKRVRVTNNSASALTNIPVKLTVTHDTPMQTGFADLRFTDASGTTSIPYWIEAVTASTQATVWVNVPGLPASSYADIFMYFGNATATSASAGTTTFLAFDDFEDGFSGYSGDTSLFAQSASIYKTNTYGLAASGGNANAQTTDGIRKNSVSVGRDTTWHFWQKIDLSTGASDQPCFLFGVQSPVTANQNYGVCLEPAGSDIIAIAKDVRYDSWEAGASELATKSVTFSTGWYEVYVDWLSSGNLINVSVYNSAGTLFATTSVSDSTYTASGSFGFTFWSQHGGWDDVWVRPYTSAIPSVSFGTKQSDSGASWLASENTYLPSYPQFQNARVRFSVRNSSLATLTENLRLQVATKLSAPNCESVPNGSYGDVSNSCSGSPTSPVCMSSSANFLNKSTSTQLLSIPNGYTFASGQILEDPSLETDGITLPAAQFTEAEYNIQTTANASLDRYCLRVVDSTTPLDNYSRVAEIQVLHPPMISDLTFNGGVNRPISLTEGTTTLVMATATVTDLNGWSDIVAASSTFFRSSVAGGSNCTADNNNCYQIATSSCGLSNCSGNSCLLSCSTRLWYFADPTDLGSTFFSDMWNAFMDVWDASGAHDSDTANQELYTLSGLTVPSSISYGGVVVGADTGSSNPSTSVTNTGNSLLNLALGGDFLRAGLNLLSYSQQKYATSSFTYSGCSSPVCTALAASSSPAYYSLGVAKATTTVWSPFKDIFWGIGIPNGTAATTFTGFNIFEARQ